MSALKIHLQSEELAAVHRLAASLEVTPEELVYTALNLGDGWSNFNLERELRRKLRRPVRVANDADVQGLGCAKGEGVELVITLGTGFGSVLFVGGLRIHLELAHHPIYKTRTYNTYIGDKALKKIGKTHWRKRVDKTIEILANLLNFDHLFIGGGNARHLRLAPASITVVCEDAAFAGGAALWSNILPGAAQ